MLSLSLSPSPPPPHPQGDSHQAAALRAFHPEEVAKQSHLEVDTLYYLQHQVHAVVSRLCEPIEGLDAACIAQCLGEKCAYRLLDMKLCSIEKLGESLGDRARQGQPGPHPVWSDCKRKGGTQLYLH